MLSGRITGYLAAFITLFIVGLVSGSMPLLMVSFIPLFLVLLGLVILPPKSLEVSMEEIPETVHVGDVISINGKVEIPSGFGTVILYRKLPDTFELVEGSNVRMIWKGPGKASADFSLRVRCSKRGEYTIAPVQWESSHFLGFTRSESGYLTGTEKNVTVKPRILNIRRIRGIKGLAASPMPVIDIAKMGVATTDFREIRNYVLGDPVRTINWKATARRSSLGESWPLVNEYEVEGKKTLWIFLDGSAGMQVGTSIENPFEYALEATSGVLHYYLDQGYKVGMYIYNNAGILYYPDAGKRQFNKISRELIDLKTSENDEDFSRAIDKCRRYILGYNPLCVVITRLDNDSSTSLIEGVTKLARLRGRRKKGLPLMVISVSGYHVVVPHGPYAENTVRLRHFETRPVARQLRAMGAGVLEWNPRQTDFGSVLLRQVKTR